MSLPYLYYFYLETLFAIADKGVIGRISNGHKHFPLPVCLDPQFFSILEKNLGWLILCKNSYCCDLCNTHSCFHCPPQYSSDEIAAVLT